MRGHIRKRARDTWTIQVYAGRDPVTGKRMQVTQTVNGTKKHAELALAKLIHSIETGIEISGAKLTVAEYAKRWLDAKRKTVRPKTLERYQDLFRLHIIPVIGTLQLQKLKPLHLEKVYERAFDRGLSAQSVQHIHRVLFSSLKQAVARQLIPRNIAEAVIAPRPERRDVDAMTPAQVVEVLQTVQGTILELPTVLGVGTGMRLGEMLGLRWSDVDLEKKTARISQTLQETHEGIIFVPPKTHRSRRGVSLPDFVVSALRPAQERTIRTPPDRRRRMERP